MRLFFAFMPPASVADKLILVGAAADLGWAGRLVSHFDLHATLAFIGNVSETGLENVRSFAHQQRALAFQLRLDRLEYWTRAAAIVMTTQGLPSPLKRFQERFQVGLALPAREAFRPHVTLVRNVSQVPVLQTVAVVRWKLRSFSLVRSNTGGLQSAYTVLDTWPLLYDE